MSGILDVTAETAASFNGRDRVLLILPYSTHFEKLLGESEVLIREPFHCPNWPGSKQAVYAGDHTTSYGWQAASAMPLDLIRFSLAIAGVKLKYDTDLVTSDYLNDGVIQIGKRFLWQRLSEIPASYGTPIEAWRIMRRAAWGQSGRSTKSLVARINVAIVQVARRQA